MKHAETHINNFNDTIQKLQIEFEFFHLDMKINSSNFIDVIFKNQVNIFL